MGKGWVRWEGVRERRKKDSESEGEEEMRWNRVKLQGVILLCCTVAVTCTLDWCAFTYCIEVTMDWC